MRWSFSQPKEPKLFFIGFNKTGTKTLHFFMQANGYASVHGKEKPWHGMVKQPFIAMRMKDNIDAGKPVLYGINKYRVYSDLTYASHLRHIEANEYFRELHAESSNAYFVFNDRPVENWIRSRIQHVSRRFGSLIENQMAVNGISREETINMWRDLYEKRRGEIVDFFRDYPRFMIFNIEQDKPEKLAQFLQADFNLDCSKWIHRGKARRV